MCMLLFVLPGHHCFASSDIKLLFVRVLSLRASLLASSILRRSLRNLFLSWAFARAYFDMYELTESEELENSFLARLLILLVGRCESLLESLYLLLGNSRLRALRAASSSYFEISVREIDSPSDSSYIVSFRSWFIPTLLACRVISACSYSWFRCSSRFDFLSAFSFCAYSSIMRSFKFYSALFVLARLKPTRYFSVLLSG